MHEELKNQFPEMVKKKLVWILIAFVFVTILFTIGWGTQNEIHNVGKSKYQLNIVPNTDLSYIKESNTIKEAKEIKLKNFKRYIGREANEKGLKNIKDNIRRKLDDIKLDYIRHNTPWKVKEIKFKNIRYDTGKGAKEIRLKSVRDNAGRAAKRLGLKNIRYNARRNKNKLELKNIRHIIWRKVEGVDLKNTKLSTKGKASKMELKNLRNNFGRKGKKKELMNAIKKVEEMELENLRNNIGRNAKKIDFMNAKRNAIGRNAKKIEFMNIKRNVIWKGKDGELNAQRKVKETELKNITIRVGKQRGILVYRVLKTQTKCNLATVVISGCKKTKHATGKIELITSFIDFVRSKVYRQTIGGIIYNDDVIEARQMEILDVLQDNLLHPVVERVHMLVWERGTAEYIRSLPLKNSEKLTLRITGKDVGLKEQLLYASECLTDRIIAISNQDNKIGKGWNNTEYHKILRDNDIMYALTRHSPIETNCTWLNDIGTCDDGEVHISTHDTFVLRARKWNAQVFDEISSITPDMLGMENLFMWFFQKKLKYRVLNPCKTLYVYHHHCVPIRGANRPRVNTGGRSVFIDFSDRLNAT